MLFMAPDSPELLRIQGCWVSEEELDALISFWTHAGQESTGTEEPEPPPWEGMSLEDAEASAETLQAGITKLGESSQKMGAAMYAAAEAEQAAAGGSDGSTGEADDDVVDAEIVDEAPAEGTEDESK